MAETPQTSITQNPRLTLVCEQAPKKDKKELDEDDKAFLEKKRAGTHFPPLHHGLALHHHITHCTVYTTIKAPKPINKYPKKHTKLTFHPPTTEEKARKDLAAKAGGKGPLNTGAQGIKKSGKK